MIRELTAVLVLLQTVPVEPVVIPVGMHAFSMSSSSMQPTVAQGEVLLADRPAADCGTTTPTPGDVVIINRDGERWVKRVVAGPGQRVAMDDGVLIIDGTPVKRVEESSPEPTASRIRETLPNGASYLTRDEGPDAPLDFFGPIIVPKGHWFTLGDNRDNSIDGRVFGSTPAADLCGLALRIIRSADPDRVGAPLTLR